MCVFWKETIANESAQEFAQIFVSLRVCPGFKSVEPAPTVGHISRVSPSPTTAHFSKQTHRHLQSTLGSQAALDPPQMSWVIDLKEQSQPAHRNTVQV